MPGRDYTRAYAALEQSVGDSFLSQPYAAKRWSVNSSWSSSTHEQNSEDIPLSTPLRDGIATDDNHIGRTLKSNGSATPPHLLRHDSGLPPTPPSKTEPIRPYTYRDSTSLKYSNHEGKAVVDHSRPLTPESTPSQSLDEHAPGLVDMFPIPSSYTESFRTALDYQQSTAGDTNASRYFSAHNLHMTPASRSFDQVPAGQKIEPTRKSYDQERAEMPNYTLRSKPALNNLASASRINKLPEATADSYIPVSFEFAPLDLDLDFTNERALTARPQTPRQHIEDTQLPVLMRGLSLRRDRVFNDQGLSGSNYISSNLRDSYQSGSSSQTRDLNQNRHSKYSTSSGTSTIVKAIIIDNTPPPRPRRLRHVGKNQDLRDDASQSDLTNDYFSHRAKPSEFNVPPSPHRVWGSIDSGTSQSIKPESPRRYRRNTNFTRETSFAELPNSPTLDVAVARQISLDRSSLETESLRRYSEDRIAYHSQAAANARRSGRQDSSSLSYHNQAPYAPTPLSFRSDSGLEALSVNEATTVSIFPHHNNSLLVVEQPASADWPGQHDKTISGIHHLEDNAYQTSTSYIDFGPPSIKLDTTLIRSPPLSEPPIVAIIPPTPAEELEDDDPKTSFAKHEVPAATPPSRGALMLKRAREYSDNVFHPLVNSDIGRSINMRRNYWNYRRSIPNVVDRKVEPGRDANLHPFWQPRGFWDDMSDSFSEDGGFDGVDGEHNRLPPGGDTSDVIYPAIYNDQLPRRFDSLKGFLIGNTLGLERGPTNRRRHIVRGFTGRKRRRTASEGGSPGSDLLASVGSSSAIESPTTGRSEEGRREDPKKISSVRESARHSAGAAYRERRRTKSRKTRAGFIGSRWLVKGWKERLMARRLRWQTR